MTHTLESIARLAGVSRGTVSRVVNNHPSVKPHIREKVLRIIEETGYHPNSQARSLAGGRTQNIGVVSYIHSPTFLSHHIFGGVIQGIQNRLAENMYDMLLFAHYSDEGHEYWRRIADKRKVDGLIILGENIREEYLMYYYDKKLPVVLVGKRFFQQVPTHLVAPNYREGALLATRHLLEQGRRRILFLRGFPNTQHESEKLAGYREALQEAGLQMDLSLIVDGRGSQELARQAILEYIDAGATFDGVVSVNDLMAFGALDAVSEVGRVVPDDVSVVGYDDILASSYVRPKLTTIRQNITGLGEQATDLLVALMTEKLPADQNHEIILDNQLIVRESSVVPK